MHNSLRHLRRPAPASMRVAIICLAVAAPVTVSGCGRFVRDQEVTGSYRLIAPDVDEQLSLSYSLDDGSAVGRVNETVFAVGWNDRYIVAKQHPARDRSRTNFITSICRRIVRMPTRK